VLFIFTGLTKVSMTKPRLFRKRDFAIFILVVVSLYLSYFESPSLSYSIEPAWFIDQPNDSTKHRGLSYKSVPPIITDLEGDGANEIIIITNNFELKVPFFLNLWTLKLFQNYDLMFIDRYLLQMFRWVKMPKFIILMKFIA
jgi:hypothetical protein